MQATMSRDLNPIILIQNRQHPLLAHAKERVGVYRRLLQRRLERAEKDIAHLKVPRLRGLRLRLPGKPFHATPELFFQVGGHTHFELPNEKVAAGPGEVMLIPSGMPHGERWLGSGFLNLIVCFHVDCATMHFGYRENGKGHLIA
jgi:mannose-6-phosphate isomerase-like protein (cupin superfamily)